MMKWLWISGVIIVLDQISKWLMSSWMTLHESITVLPFFNLTLAHNTGAAFSFLAQAGGWQRWFLVGLAMTISIVLLVWLKRITDNKLEALSISLILGGAVGNVIDRIYYGYVIDFIDIYYDTHHWPAFNVADSAIVIGAILLVLDSTITKAKTP